VPASKRLTLITDGEVTFSDTKGTKKFDSIYIHPSSKWVKTTTTVQGKEAERWYPIRRVSEIRRDHSKEE
jgi:hypothetical protein